MSKAPKPHPKGASVSHRQVGVKRSEVGGLLRHEFRSVDRRHGTEASHSNERIVPERTRENRCWMWVDGVQMPVEKTADITAELDRRLKGAVGSVRKASRREVKRKDGSVKKVKVSGGTTPVRKDARVVRDIVLQLDPALTGTVEDPLMSREAVEAALWEMVGHYEDLYGRENLLALSFHWDETSPHAHLLVTPIDELGRVRQASFIADGRGKNSGMAANDRAMRQRMISAGYAVAPEPTGSVRGHMRVDDYARHAGWVESVVERERKAVAKEDVQKARGRFQDQRGAEQDEREQQLDQREQALEQREQQLEQRERNLNERERELNELTRGLSRVREIFAAAHKRLEAADRQRVFPAETLSAVKELDGLAAQQQMTSRKPVSQQRKQPE